MTNSAAVATVRGKRGRSPCPTGVGPSSLYDFGGLDMPCRVRVDRVLAGKVRTISTDHVRVVLPSILRAGKMVRVSIDWPYCSGRCFVEFEGRGRVVYSSELETAIAILRYGFQYRSNASLSRTA